ncbi:DNA translocase FtsK [Paenibacillus sp. HN-1]|nr:DNA translocase FtsK [Paenibacillus sp. CGMCC 1.18879]MBY9085895.1 DNA translocase FtsK [Paenibacillus sinensis]
MLHPNNVISQTQKDLSAALMPGGESDSVYMLGKDIGGGYAGGLSFALLLLLFGTLGAKLIMIVMLAISFMLVTNLSYIELFGLLRVRLVKLARELKKRAANRPKAVPVASRTSGSRGRSRKDDEEEHEEEDEEEQESSLPSRKAPQFFERLIQRKSSRERVELDPELEDEPAPPTEVIPIMSGFTEPSNDDFDDFDDFIPEEGDLEGVTPIIRDFFEHIRSEGLSDEEREEWGEFSPTARGSLRTVDPEPNVEQMPDDFGDPGLAPEEPGSLAAEAGGTMDAASASGIAEPVPGAEGPDPVPKPKPKPYKLPPFRLLSKPNNGGKGSDQSDYMQTARKLEATLESFNVRAKVLEVVRGPAVTRYEIQPDIGVKVSRIVNLTDDIALALAAKDIRMEAPIPGKSAIGIEVPNPEVSLVTMREVMETQIFQEAESKLTIAFGRDISGQTIIGNLARMPHLLVAGATGSGKSVCINGIITSILYKAKPDEVKFLMVDPKMVELNVYNGIPHLMAPVVTDPKRASLALKKIVVEMEKRYELFSKSGTRNVEGYNQLMKDNPAAVLPYIVVIVDELADLMMVAAGDVEDAICRLAQMARAAGIHLIIATQRPSVDVITGVIKANIPSRIAFGVSSQVDSRTILDMAGAEKLLGRGDMLFMPMGSSKPIRVQGAFMSDAEVEAIVHYVSSQGEAEYDESIVPEIDDTSSEAEEPQDELYDQAVQIVLEAKQASVSLLQRRMRVGYTRAARLIDSMEARGVIGPYEGSKPREVLISLEQYQQNRISS